MYDPWYREDGVTAQIINNKCRDNLKRYTAIFVRDEELYTVGYNAM